MPIVSMLIFFGTFMFIVWAIIIIYLTSYNRKTRLAIDKFIKEAVELNPVVFYNIKLRYWTSSGQRIQVSPYNRCDLYLFNDCLAILRRQNFLFKINFAPVLITNDIEKTKAMFNYLDTYQPTLVQFNQIVKGDVEIKITHPVYHHKKNDITLKGLTGGQLKQLESIKSFAFKLS